MKNKNNPDKNKKTPEKPSYYEKAVVRCACGASFNVGSTQELIEIEICSECHPFFTGKKKIVDTMGRVERFQSRLEKKKEYPQKKKKERKAEKKEAKQKKGKEKSSGKEKNQEKKELKTSKKKS